MKILHLSLQAKWYDMIERGEKTEEYREIKPYWEKRLIDYKALKANYQAIALKRYMLGIWTDVCKAFPRGYTHVLLRRPFFWQTSPRKECSESHRKRNIPADHSSHSEQQQYH